MFQKFRGIIGIFIFLLLGSLLYLFESKNAYTSVKNHDGLSFIKIQRILKQNEKNIHAKGISVDARGKYQFSAILYVKKDSVTESIFPGDFILCSTKLNRIEDVHFPYAFSAKKYYETKGITHACFISSKNIIYHEKKNSINLYRIAYKINRKMTEAINRWPINNQAKEVLIALLTGTKDYLAEETRAAYADTGTIHVLAVSGLHTGLIYVLLLSILSFLLGNRLKIFQTLILISGLWFYALFTGLSPSVIRAATMFTFIELGKSIKRKTGIYHSLCLSAILLLSTSPFLLFDIGFQLSYSAVYGIVNLSNFLNRLFSISSHFVIKKITEIFSVSLAAQLFTAPFTLYYFSKFPTWFFIANIYAIPLITLTLYIGFPLAIVSLFSSDFDVLGNLPAFFVTINNKLNYLIQKLPYSVLDRIFIDHIQFMLLLISIILLSFSIVNRRKKTFFTGLSMVLLLQLYSTVQSFIIHQVKTEVYLISFQEKPLLLINAGGEKVWILSDNHEKIISKSSSFFSKYFYRWYIKENDIFWLEMPQEIVLTKDENPLLQISITRVSENGRAVKTRWPMQTASIKILPEGKRFILNRNGDRVLIL